MKPLLSGGFFRAASSDGGNTKRPLPPQESPRTASIAYALFLRRRCTSVVSILVCPINSLSAMTLSGFASSNCTAPYPWYSLFSQPISFA